MKVFITGIAGFLGSHLTDALLKRGHEVSGCDTLLGGYVENVPEDADFHQVDCTYLNAMKKVTKGFDTIIHTACTAYEGLSVFSPHLVCQNTFQISVSIMTACAENKIKRFVNCSSMARYGKQDSYPFVEDMIPMPVDPYGVAKLAAEKVLKILSDQHGFEYINLVPHNIIGPRQKYNDPYRNVASIMINLMLQERQPIIYGDGEQLRCFSDVDDIIPCFVKSVEESVAVGETINIGPDEESVTINKLSKIIAEVVGFKNLDPVYIDPRPCEVKHATCSAEKSRKFFGYKTNHNLIESVEKLTESIKKKGPKKFRYGFDIEIKNDKTPRTWKERLF